VSPGLDRLESSISDSQMSLILTDSKAHVVKRWVGHRDLAARLDRIYLAPGFYYGERDVGTNGIGTALEGRAATYVVQDEHYSDQLAAMACAGAPLIDPARGAVVGVVDLSCPVEHATPLMRGFVEQAAWQIAQCLRTDQSPVERQLTDAFLAARRRSKGPIAVVSNYTMQTNAAASRIVQPSDRVVLWDWARVAANGACVPSPIKLADGT
jgi:sigma-54 dependent transcriptional regulator, acetoin dehydrogenase operon transcriptional activator AcoR